MIFPAFALAIESAEDQGLVLELYQKHQWLMLAIAFKYLQNEADAQDAVSDMWINLIHHLDTIRPLEAEAQRAYLSVMVKNSTLQLLRKRRIRNEVMLNPEMTPQQGENSRSPEEHVMHQVLMKQMKSALSQLDDEQRRLTKLKYVHHMSDKKIADRMGCTSQAVRSRLTRLRKKLFYLMWEADGTEMERQVRKPIKPGNPNGSRPKKPE